MERSQDRQGKKIIESFIEKDYQEDTWQRHCIDGMIGNLIRSIRADWKEIGDIGRECNTRKKEHWK